MLNGMYDAVQSKGMPVGTIRIKQLLKSVLRLWSDWNLLSYAADLRCRDAKFILMMHRFKQTSEHKQVKRLQEVERHGRQSTIFIRRICRM